MGKKIGAQLIAMAVTGFTPVSLECFNQLSYLPTHPRLVKGKQCELNCEMVVSVEQLELKDCRLM